MARIPFRLENWSDFELRLIIGRFFSRAGDHAWDFAVPMAILRVCQGQLHLPILYYFCARIGTVFFMPSIGTQLDRKSLRFGLASGTILQIAGVTAGTFFLVLLAGDLNQSVRISGDQQNLLLFISLILSGIIASFGAAALDISIMNMVVPAMVPKARLSAVNSRIAQADLAVEVLAPLGAGFLLIWKSDIWVLSGFLMIALLNILSFLPEISLIFPRLPRSGHSIGKRSPDTGGSVQERQVLPDRPAGKNIFFEIFRGWKSFFNEPVALSIFAYSFLWLSILSPHGVLLTTYLKGVWNIDEPTLGLFRAFGALFGFLGTFAFPGLAKRFGLLRASSWFISWQALMVISALLAFLSVSGLNRSGAGIFLFLAFILLSRIGLYGFCLGETEIRQIAIAPEARGRVNGFTSSWLSLMTLLIYGVGSLLSSSEGFLILVCISAGAVAAAAAIFYWWRKNMVRNKQLVLP